MNEERLSLSKEHFPSSKLTKNGLRDKQNGSLKKWQQIQSKNEKLFHFTYDIDIFILYIKNKS